jgi:hypothetical protein
VAATRPFVGEHSTLAPRERRRYQASYQVTVPERLGERPELREDVLERVVLESSRLLLEREPATSILGHFSLSDTSRYFPE